MAESWTLESPILQSTTGSMRTSIDSSRRAAPSINFDYRRSFVLQFEDIRYRVPEGQTEIARPASSSYLVQEPYVVMPQRLESDVGLRMIAQVLRAEEGVIVDVRLETIADLESVILSASFGQANGPSTALRTIQTDTRPIMEMLDDNEIVGIAVGDLGEAGRVNSTPNGVNLSFFDQSLEKGVILVGRWGVIPRRPHESTSSLRERASHCLRQASFL